MLETPPPATHTPAPSLNTVESFTFTGAIQLSPIDDIYRFVDAHVTSLIPLYE